MLETLTCICRIALLNPNDASANQSIDNSPCLMPKDPGNCRASIKSFYFEAKTGQCAPFFYTGFVAITLYIGLRIKNTILIILYWELSYKVVEATLIIFFQWKIVNKCAKITLLILLNLNLRQVN